MRLRELADFLTPLSLLTAGCLAALVYHLRIRARLLELLRTRHPDTWRQLGSPSVLVGLLSYGIDFMRLLHWLWLRQERDLEDPELARLAQLHRRTQVVPVVIFFGGAVPACLGRYDFLLWHI